MKKILTSATLACAVLLSANAARAADQAIAIGATVTATCSLADAGGDGATFTVAYDGATGGPTTTAHAATIVVGCNAASNITLSSSNGGATETTGAVAPSGSTNFFDYTVTANDGTSDIVTLNTSSTVTTGVAEATVATEYASAGTGGTLTLTITPIAGDPLIVGSYADTLTVTIDPQ